MRLEHQLSLQRLRAAYSVRAATWVMEIMELSSDLIDGDGLCELLKRYDLGVRTTARAVGDVSIDGTFFGEI